MIRPELLKSFIAAADSGSFSAAAKLVGKHLSTVSGNISRLEEELNLELFDRDGKYPQITEAGTNLYDSAKVIVDSSERFFSNALQLSRGESVHITVAIDENIDSTPFVQQLPELKKKWPHIGLTLIYASPIEIFEKVKKQEVDVALIPALEGYNSFYDFKAIGQLEVKVVANQNHPLAKTSRINNNQLMTYTQIIPELARVEPDILKLSRMSHYVWYAQGYHSMLAMLTANLGWALLITGSNKLPEGLTTLDTEFKMTKILIQYDAIWPNSRQPREIELFLINIMGRLFD
ncbi:LysR family transcriptional regulator [Vibrio sp. 10N.261.51.F12]|uniref:LysR family transcriptional regulator n=1 Tax=Vibrio sp. 10N.261.51.F12 TaxID=3229679 RepID=UPI003551DDDB